LSPAALQDLGRLRHLWLAENPCAEQANYRQTVICSLPQLEKLDNTPITAQERAEALRFGEPVDWAAEWDGRRGEDPLPASSDQENQERRLSLSLYGDQEEYRREAQLQEDRREARYGDSYSVAGYQDSSSISQYGVMERAAQQEDVRSVWQYGDTRNVSQYTDNMEMSQFQDNPHSSLSSFQYQHGCPTQFHQPRLQPARRSTKNILSAILCLVKAVDIASLEVVAMAVRCRMEELEDSS